MKILNREKFEKDLEWLNVCVDKVLDVGRISKDAKRCLRRGDNYVLVKNVLGKTALADTHELKFFSLFLSKQTNISKTLSSRCIL